MCLSTVYASDDLETAHPLARSVTSVRVADGRIILTDLLGMETEINGLIEQIDLIKNCITIKMQATAH